MSNSKKLRDDAAKHRGFVSSGEQAWLEESEFEQACIKVAKGLIKGTISQGIEPLYSNHYDRKERTTCSHKETVKKHLLTSHYYVCKACGEEV
jgi:hypothetical protein